MAALGQLPLKGVTVEEARTALVGKIGENVSIRRFSRMPAKGRLMTYVHGGARIGVLVDVIGGDETLAKDLAMHIAFAKPLALGPADVPAELVRHPAVFGRLARSKPLAVHELRAVRGITSKPVKVALPGPYLLTRTMWLECVSDKVYADRETLAADIVRVLREEIAELLASEAAIVQLDEPVLTEVVFTRPSAGRSFMCGALGARHDTDDELVFAGQLIRDVLTGFPTERLALHVCRGNWSRQEEVLLAGSYEPLMPVFGRMDVDQFVLEYATPRAGPEALLATLPAAKSIGFGAVNPRTEAIEDPAAIAGRVRALEELLGAGRVFLNPDCGFGTFAERPVARAEVAFEKLRTLARAAELLRSG